MPRTSDDLPFRGDNHPFFWWRAPAGSASIKGARSPFNSAEAENNFLIQFPSALGIIRRVLIRTFLQR